MRILALTVVPRKCGIVYLILFLLFQDLLHASMFGEETGVLIESLSVQIQQLNNLADEVGIGKDQIEILTKINEGVSQTTRQIQALDAIIERAQGVDPTSIKSLSDINKRIDDLKFLSNEIQELVIYKMVLCDEAVEESSIQSQTTYKMGQEMVGVGAQLAQESQTASPGRAQQITASASAAQMLAMGVELQTLSQMSQVLALSLDLQKTQMEKDLKMERMRKAYFKQALVHSSRRPSLPVFSKPPGGKDQ